MIGGETANAAGSLTVVGIGVQGGDQLTREVIEAIKKADEVYYLVADGFGEAAILELAPSAVDLGSMYVASQRRRHDVYEPIAQRLVEAVLAGNAVCFAVYGHPVFAAEAPRFAGESLRRSGLPVTFLPGVSSLDCLLTDLLIDPVQHGMQICDATRFLQEDVVYEPRSTIVLLQIGTLGNFGWPADYDQTALDDLTDLLASSHGADHQVIVYEAPSFAMTSPRIEKFPVRSLPAASINVRTTLVIPPIKAAPRARGR